jgi:hypothetical protein
MALVVNDRVQEFTITTGTGTLTLTGSPDGFETFSNAIGNGNTTYYAISSNTTEFEVGIGTVGAGTLSRDTVISSSNSDALVNFSAGTKNVFVTLPASKAVYLDSTGAPVLGRTGSVNWDTTAKTASFTAVSGNGYFANTTSADFTITLPTSPSAGDIVSISDYAGTFSTNNLTVARNGSNIRGSAADLVLSVNNQTVTLIYVDGTQGWNLTQESNNVNNFIAATGGTTTICGDFKIHTFTGPGTFCVSSLAVCSSNNEVDYLVVAGGGGSGSSSSGGGGGGAGGFRESGGTASGCYSVSPLGACVSALPVTATGYPIVIGAGGTGIVVQPTSGGSSTSGSLSSFSTIISAGGGLGGSEGPTPRPAGNVASPGGSGGGEVSHPSAPPSVTGSGNTPPVSPPQGNPGGLGNSPSGAPISAAGGGGGATAAGGDGNGPKAGGAGATTSISASPTAYAGGGGGASRTGGEGGGAGGVGGGGNGSSGTNYNQENGTTNTGGGAGGKRGVGFGVAGNGGSGIVIIRYKFQ